MRRRLCAGTAAALALALATATASPGASADRAAIARAHWLEGAPLAFAPIQPIPGFAADRTG